MDDRMDETSITSKITQYGAFERRVSFRRLHLLLPIVSHCISQPSSHCNKLEIFLSNLEIVIADFFERFFCKSLLLCSLLSRTESQT